MKARLVLLLGVSLLVHGVVWLPVALYHVPPVYDECGYFDRGIGFTGCFSDLLSGNRPTAAHWQAAFHLGFQPPLHPLLLGIFMLLVGQKVALARLLVVIWTALTTPLVYRLTVRLARDREGAHRLGLAAAVVHLLYPGFIAYSHYLWSEPLFILLLLGAIERALAARGPRGLLPALTAGVCLGLLALTRSVGLGFLLVVPAWFWGRDRRRLGRSVIMLLAGVLLLAPWQVVLDRNGAPDSLIATSGGLNLLLGNNPGVPAGYGSSWRHITSRDSLLARADSLARATGVTPDHAARKLALRYLRADPAGALRRAVLKFRTLWTPDLFLVRHVAHAAYPPLPRGGLTLVWLGTVAAYLLLLFLVVRGWSSGTVRHGGLLGVLVVVGMAPALLAIAMPRLHQPLLALMLPFAGAGIVARPRFAKWRGFGAGLAAAVLAWVVISGLPRVVDLYLEPSSWYRHEVQTVDRLLGSHSTFSDRIVLRAGPDAPGGSVRLRPGKGQAFLPGMKTELTWLPSDEPWLELMIQADGSPGPSTLVLSRGDGPEARIEPVRKACWRSWCPVGLEDVFVQWEGGGKPLPWFDWPGRVRRSNQREN